MVHYFFNLVTKKGKTKIKPVDGQLKGINKIDSSLNVTCRNIKSIINPSIPVYFSDDIFLSATTKYYTVKGFTPLTDEYPEIMNEYNSLVSKPTEEEKVKKTKESIPCFYERLSTDPELIPPSSEEDGFYITTNDWGILSRNVKKHINTLILGPAGCGKTSCIKILAERLGLTLHIFDMGSMIDPVSSLLGVHRLESGASIFDYAKFTRVIQEPGIILLDELSRAPQSAMNILLPCLDDRRKLSIEIACGKGIREINVHPEVTFIATANIGVEYCGTNSLDRALVNRFFMLELGYIPQEEEVAVLVKRTGVSSNVSESIVKIANNIRNLYSKSEISISPSIRETLAIADLVCDGWPLSDAMQVVLLPLFEGTKNEGERGVIYKTLISY